MQMSTRRSILILLVAGVLLVAAYLLLPDLASDRGQRREVLPQVAQDTLVISLDTTRGPGADLHGEPRKLRRLVRQARRVEAGEALAEYQSPYNAELLKKAIDQRLLLSAEELAAAPFPPNIKEELAQLAQQAPASAPTGTQLTQAERELLEAELFGAEDASTELLRRLADPKLGPEQRLEAELKLQVAQSQLVQLRAKLARPPAAKAQSVDIDTLMEQYRAVLNNFPNTKPERINAERAGYYVPSTEAGQLGVLIVQREDTLALPVANSSAAYYLVPRGLPVLRAKAARVDSVAANRADGAIGVVRR